MSQSNNYNEAPVVPVQCLVGLANATVLGRWGHWSLPGGREERQATAEDRIRRAAEALGGSALEIKATVYEYRDLLS